MSRSSSPRRTGRGGGTRSRGDAALGADARARASRGLRDGWDRTRQITAEVAASLRHRPGIDRAVRDASSRDGEVTGTDVHRRIAARRAEVAADEAFVRRSRALSFVLGVVVAAAIAALLFLTPVLSVREIEVVGLDAGSAVDADAIVHSAGVHRGDNLLLVSSTVAAGGAETVPGVESATVHKTFPGKVRIEVVPRVVVAATPVPGGFALLDASATVVEVRSSIDGVEVPVVRGTGPATDAPDGSAGSGLGGPGSLWGDGLGRQAVAAIAALPPGVLPRVLEAGYDAGALTMTFAGTPKVVFGTSDDMAKKADVAVRVLADIRARGVAVEYVDVSSPVVPTIRPRS